MTHSSVDGRAGRVEQVHESSYQETHGVRRRGPAAITAMISRFAARALEVPLVYRLLQAPFQERKIAPCLAQLHLTPQTRLLDVGCGPGTNAHHFAHTLYTGIDVNQDYVHSARRRHAGRFVVGDATNPDVLPREQFDIILLNSLMHHLPDDAVAHLLSRLVLRLALQGRIHILDLILPPDASAARLLARMDRGRFARPLDAWHALFAQSMHIEQMSTFPLGVPGLPLWHMVYCIGGAV